jgi:K+-sensing histidine kinase KdpD
MTARAFAGHGVVLDSERSERSALARAPARLTKNLAGYLWGALSVALCSELALLASRYLELSDIIMIHLVGVVVIATRFDVKVSIFTAIASVLAFDFLFVPPVFVLTLMDAKSSITCAGMLVVAIVISTLTTRARRLESAARERELRTARLALERAELAEKAALAELAAEREHVQNALLRSISHDFRTPLAAIVGAGQSLVDYGTDLEPEARRLLERTVVEQARRLNRLLTNVLSATRLEHGELGLERTPCTLDEIVEGALRHLGDTAQGRRIDVSLPFDLPLVEVDPVLVEQLVVNVLENALRYSPEATLIELSASAEHDFVHVSVADRGPGVARGDERRIFEKFYRGARVGRADGGMGLGLTICRAIAGAHGGTIAAANRPGGGLVVTTALPRAPERSYPNTTEAPLLSERSC